MSENCHDCKYLEWGFGDIGDPEGWCCLKRDYGKYGHDSYKEENKHLKQLESKAYRMKYKKCCEKELINKETK